MLSWSMSEDTKNFLRCFNFLATSHLDPMEFYWNFTGQLFFLLLLTCQGALLWTGLRPSFRRQHLPSRSLEDNWRQLLRINGINQSTHPQDYESQPVLFDRDGTDQKDPKSGSARMGLPETSFLQPCHVSSYQLTHHGEFIQQTSHQLEFWSLN